MHKCHNYSQLSLRRTPLGPALSVCLREMFVLSGLLIFRGKKSKISRDFQGQIRGKIGWFRGIFAGKKSKFAQKSAHFAWFSREKSQNSQKNQPISRDFSGKSQISKDFRGKFVEKSADFAGNFWGKLRQETVSEKQPISLDVFGKFR